MFINKIKKNILCQQRIKIEQANKKKVQESWLLKDRFGMPDCLVVWSQLTGSTFLPIAESRMLRYGLMVAINIMVLPTEWNVPKRTMYCA